MTTAFAAGRWVLAALALALCAVCAAPAGELPEGDQLEATFRDWQAKHCGQEYLLEHSQSPLHSVRVDELPDRQWTRVYNGWLVGTQDPLVVWGLCGETGETFSIPTLNPLGPTQLAEGQLYFRTCGEALPGAASWILSLDLANRQMQKVPIVTNTKWHAFGPRYPIVAGRTWLFSGPRLRLSSEPEPPRPQGGGSIFTSEGGPVREDYLYRWDPDTGLRELCQVPPFAWLVPLPAGPRVLCLKGKEVWVVNFETGQVEHRYADVPTWRMVSGKLEDPPTVRVGKGYFGADQVYDQSAQSLLLYRTEPPFAVQTIPLTEVPEAPLSRRLVVELDAETAYVGDPKHGWAAAYRIADGTRLWHTQMAPLPRSANIPSHRYFLPAGDMLILTVSFGSIGLSKQTGEPRCFFTTSPDPRKPFADFHWTQTSYYVQTAGDGFFFRSAEVWQPRVCTIHIWRIPAAADAKEGHE